MADREHLKILKQGVRVWNEWRDEHPHISANLISAKLNDCNLVNANLSRVSFICADLIGANLRGADLSRANLSSANLSGANLEDTTLRSTNLHTTDLSFAILKGADLRYATLYGTNISNANFSSSNLEAATLLRVKAYRTNFKKISIAQTSFLDFDFREVEGLETVQHWGPSEISISTVYLSEGKIPKIFLSGCGVPDVFMTQIPALVAAIQPIKFSSCFISYSSKDEKFAHSLYSRMRDAGLRVWFAREAVKGGQKLIEQIDEAIETHERLILILSENSIGSEWVITEIRKARKVEVVEKRRKLFPIRLVDYETLKSWACFDADQGKDLAVELREYYVPDFSNWEDNESFELAFNKLLRDLESGS